MSRRVLVIEDEPNIVEAIRFILSRAGFEVVVHSDGADAVAMIRSTVPDIVVLDVMLPGRSGYEILTEIRADPVHAETPVLVLTARGQDRERIAAERAGANGFMAKPFSNADMLALVRELAGAGT